MQPLEECDEKTVVRFYAAIGEQLCTICALMWKRLPVEDMCKVQERVRPGSPTELDPVIMGRKGGRYGTCR